MSTPPDRFAATRWTLVLRAKGVDSVGQSALSELCDAYYAAVVTFLRFRAGSDDAAREQAHAFFARILRGEALSGADPARGRFRSYLLSAVKNFLADEHDRAAAGKRGGGMEAVPLHETAAQSVPAPEADEAAFDRQWALTVIARALGIVGAEWQASGKETQFELLKPFLSGSGEPISLSDAAQGLGLSEGATKVAVHRLRSRFREVVKQEIAQTVPGEADIDDELRHLIAALMSAAPADPSSAP